MNEQWQFGRYLDILLEKKNWSRNKLAKEVSLSSGYITWLINGFSSDKVNPPKPSIDVFLMLSKALNVPITSLIAAYQGKDPDKIQGSGTQEDYKALIMELLKKLPSQDVIELALLKVGDSTENREEMRREIVKHQEASVEKSYLSE